MSKKSVYLAGKIFGATDHEATYWRAIARSRLEAAGYLVRDPMDRDYRQVDTYGREAEIVEADINDIASSSLVLASCLEPSWGTAMELRVAWQFSVPVYAIANLAKPTSLWLRYHSHRIFLDVADAVQEIILRGPPRHAKTPPVWTTPAGMAPSPEALARVRATGVASTPIDSEGRLVDERVTTPTEDLAAIATIAERNMLRAPPEMIPALRAIAERARRAAARI